jgi:hypothetical protein
MRQWRYSQRATALNMSKILTGLQLPSIVKVLKPIDSLSILLPLCAIILWSTSLKDVDIRGMTDLGLVSVLPPSTIIALIILTISFCLALRPPRLRQPIILLHLVLLVFMLYGVTTLLEEAPRFVDVYRHAGYVEYIMRNGTVDPKLDIYFDWPVFFILSAFVTQVAGYHSALSFVGWASVFFNLIYLGPLYIIFTSATTDKRLVWLGLWFFFVTKWVSQDHFSPQAFDFFLYLVIIAILLKWFKVPTAAQLHIRKQRWQLLSRFPLPAQRLVEGLRGPDMLRTPTQPGQRAALLVILILIFALVVSSHPLTPFFLVASVSILVIFRRCTPFWLPILMSIMTAAWIIFMTQPFLAEHFDLVIGSFGHADISSNLIDRLQGDPEHKFIAAMRVIMTAFIWGLAFVGGARHLRKGYGDLTYVLLAIAPFPLFVANSYTGEILIRIYLFSLPLMAFFAASLFYTRPTSAPSQWMTAAVLGISIVLLGGFLFTRYGTERLEYKTNDEINGVRYLYSIAPPNSLFLQAYGGTAWQFQDYEKYSGYELDDALPDAVETQNVDAIVQFIEEQTNYPKTYVIFTRSQKATADSDGMPPGMLDQLQKALLASGKFKMVFSNPDAQIFEYVPKFGANEHTMLITR